MKDEKSYHGRLTESIRRRAGKKKSGREGAKEKFVAGFLLLVSG
jgi:hypothetical protein